MQRLTTALTWTCRLLVGAVFAFSGIAKGIDPWGTLYKFQEYMAAMGLPMWSGLLHAGVFGLCAVEFTTGIFLICGCFRRSTPVIAAIMMGVMLPLTLWIAVFNPVADCGCFGDAVEISNWATFWKNVVISAAVGWLLFNNRKCRWLIRPYIQWLAIVACGTYILAISLFGYLVQPMLDFRPYPEGATLLPRENTAGNDTDDPLGSIVFIYSKDGVEKEFRADEELPEESEGWKFVERRTSIHDAAQQKKAVRTDRRELRVWSEDGEEDVTDEVIGDGRQLLLMIPQIEEISAAATWRINSLYQWCGKQGIEMMAIAGGNPEEISRWKDTALAEYPIYTADDTSIKEVVRGNPGVVYLSDGVIQWKTSLRSMDADDFMSPDTSADPSQFDYDYKRIFLNISLIYIAVMSFLVVLSYSPAMARFFFNSKTQDK